jgi:hypothetical protein
MAQKDNLGSKTRFIEGGAVVNRHDEDSYPVRNESGKLAKRRHYDLKGSEVDVGETPSRGDM